MERNSQRLLELFYCYASKDRALRDGLDKHLAGLRRSGLIITWYDGQILPGVSWEQSIEEHLDMADIILLLVSPDFISSDNCYSKEMMHAIERHDAKDACVIPILLRPVDWANTPFSQLQMLPSNARPITLWQNRDEAFEDVAKGIRQVVDELLRRQKPNGIVQGTSHLNRPNSNQSATSSQQPKEQELHTVSPNQEKASSGHIERQTLASSARSHTFIAAALHMMDDFIEMPPWSNQAEIRFSITNLTDKPLKLAKLVLYVDERKAIDKVRLKKEGASFREFTLFADVSDADEVDMLKGTKTQFVLDPRGTEAFCLSFAAPEGYRYTCQIYSRLDDLVSNEQLWIEGKSFQVEYPIRSIEVLRTRKGKKR
jgi:TIR domain